MVGGFNFKGFYCLASASLTISNLSLFLKNPKTATPKPTRTSIALTTESKFSVSKLKPKSNIFYDLIEISNKNFWKK